MPSRDSACHHRALDLGRIESVPIVLCGFMGVGKSTVGRRLARRLGRAFVDLDERVVVRLGRPIVEVFAAGEEHLFRATEAAALEELLQATEPAVIALGGGAYERPETRAMLRGRSVVVHLDQSFDDLYPALARLRESRPLLQAKSREEIEALYRHRRQNYLQADLTVALPRDGVPRAARAVFDALARYAREHVDEQGSSPVIHSEDEPDSSASRSDGAPRPRPA